VAGDIVLRRGGAEDQGAPAGDLARIVSSGGLGNAAGSAIGSGSPATTTRASGPVGEA
jgi:hypothetical protein